MTSTGFLRLLVGCVTGVTLVTNNYTIILRASIPNL